MNNERKEEIRLEDKKYGKRFALIMVLSLIVGLALGLGCIRLMDADQSLLDHLGRWVIPVCADILMWIAMLIGFPAAACLMKKASAIAASADAEDDTAEDRIEAPLNLALTIQTFLQVLVFTCSGMTFSVLGAMNHGLVLSKEVFLTVWISGLAGMILCLVLSVVQQRSVVNMVKERNPEKQGSIFQTDFNKTWLSSCDEAEKAQAYEAAFKAYRVGTHACLFMWLLSVFAAILGWAGWFTVFSIGVIWGALQVSYCLFCTKKKNPSNISGSAHIAG